VTYEVEKIAEDDRLKRQAMLTSIRGWRRRLKQQGVLRKKLRGKISSVSHSIRNRIFLFFLLEIMHCSKDDFLCSYHFSEIYIYVMESASNSLLFSRFVSLVFSTPKIF